MTSLATSDPLEAAILARPSVRDLHPDERDALIISTRKVDGTYVVLSRYGDDVWWATGAPTNVAKASTKIDFSLIPIQFRAVFKEVMYRMRFRGRSGSQPAGVSQMVTTVKNARPFFMYAAGLGIGSLSAITPLTCSAYAHACKTSKPVAGRSHASNGKPLSKATLQQRLVVVEVIYELSQHTSDPMPQHPWVDSSADSLSQYGKFRRAGNTTPLMDDLVFTSLFQKAWSIVQSADGTLDVRDEMNAIEAAHTGQSDGYINHLKRKAHKRLGWAGGGHKLVESLLEIRTACYVVIASLSGCRNHELSFLNKNAYYSTEDDEGERFWWMRSRSTKTDEGFTEWMIPEAAVTALRVMDRWAVPYQNQLLAQIDAYREADPSDVRIAEAQEHVNAIFLGSDKANDNQIRTLSLTQTNNHLRAFAKSCGLTWKLSSHQFRRKFANYAARSRFGDLRYLKEHFKHWSLDMTLGYALNESQEMALYLEIEDELDDLKRGVVAGWLDQAEPLAGGYGHRIASWRDRDENITLFKSHSHMIRSIAESTAIRSNGHAWCTADDRQCDGNDLDPTRCAGGGQDGFGCASAVIGRRFTPIYVALYDSLKALADCADIGEGGRARVQRDLQRCRSVLTDLGHDPLETVA